MTPRHAFKIGDIVNVFSYRTRDCRPFCEGMARVVSLDADAHTYRVTFLGHRECINGYIDVIRVAYPGKPQNEPDLFLDDLLDHWRMSRAA